jgi:DNA-binding NtrC family response regulator
MHRPPDGHRADASDGPGPFGMAIKYPQNDDLRRLVRFSSEDGTIWLAENRMLLLHTAALAGLRRELINSVGPEHARRALTRMGFASGTRDAELAKKIRGGQDPIDAFVVGPQLHMLEGSVRVTPVRLDMEVPARFYGEFLWENSWEAEAHLAEYGPQHDPVCWMLIGYASGYTSAFMGRFILFQEVQCAGCGPSHCRIVGRPVEQWANASDHLPYYEETSIVTRLQELRTAVDALRSSLDPQHGAEALVGQSPAFKKSYELLEKAAATQVSVLLLGETGVGKERFARALHRMGSRREGPFIAVNCAAMPHELIESELFGVEKGAFTGAQSSRAGRFERAEGGTLFLDEVGELPLASQAKLLRALQDGEIERLGGEKSRKVNVRIVAATNIELEEAVKAGRFRSDLYYRLNVYPIRIPPLRERPLDIAPLVQATLSKFSVLHEKRVAGVTDRALSALKLYTWPGNVRELENMIERGVILAPAGGWIEFEHLFASPPDARASESHIGHSGALESEPPAGQQQLCAAVLASGLSLDALEELLLQEAMRRADGNMAGAARMLGLTRPKLAYRLKRSQEGGGEAERQQ